MEYSIWLTTIYQTFCMTVPNYWNISVHNVFTKLNKFTKCLWYCDSPQGKIYLLSNKCHIRSSLFWWFWFWTTSFYAIKLLPVSTLYYTIATYIHKCLFYFYLTSTWNIVYIYIFPFVLLFIDMLAIHARCIRCEG